jgi:hypothetical protein
MKDPTFASAYVAFYPMLSEITRAHGYALAVHGSVTRDFDLIAVPWTKEADEADTLILAIAKFAGLITSKPDLALIGPEEKEHGRRAWSIMVGNGAVIDFSILPKEPNP